MVNILPHAFFVKLFFDRLTSVFVKKVAPSEFYGWDWKKKGTLSRPGGTLLISRADLQVH